MVRGVLLRWSPLLLHWHLKVLLLVGFLAVLVVLKVDLHVHLSHGEYFGFEIKLFIISD